MRPQKSPMHADANGRMLLDTLDYLADPDLLIPFKEISPDEFKRFWTSGKVKSDWDIVKKEIQHFNKYSDEMIREFSDAIEGKVTSPFKALPEAKLYPAYSSKEHKGNAFEVRVPASGESPPQIAFQGKQISFEKVQIDGQPHWLGYLDTLDLNIPPAKLTSGNIQPEIKIAGTIHPEVKAGFCVRNALKKFVSSVSGGRIFPESHYLLNPDLKRKFPKLEETFLKIRSGIPSGNKITHPRELPYSKNADRRRVSDQEMKLRAESLPPEIRETIVGVYNKLNDRKHLSDYYEKLFVETTEAMAKRADIADLRRLEAGSMSRDVMGEVLINRFKARGDVNFVTLTGRQNDGKYLSYGIKDLVPATPDLKAASLKTLQSKNDAFRLAVRTGPFVDEGVDIYARHGHGALSHMIQRDIVSDIIKETMRGRSQEFWDFLGSKKGVAWWVDLFDSFDKRSMSSPEVLQAFISHKMTRDTM